MIYRVLDLHIDVISRKGVALLTSASSMVEIPYF